MNRKDFWGLLSKFSIIITIAIGVISLAQIVWGYFSKFQNGVPMWLFLTSSISCFLFGLFLSLWGQRNRFQTAERANLRKIGQINFDYLPSAPTEHGWILGFDSNAPENVRPPEFSAAQDSPVTGSLAINGKKYKIDYNVNPVQALANIVEYYVKPIDGAFYLRIDISSRDKTQVHTVWLRHVIGTGAPCEFKNGMEWTIEVQGEILEDGWILVKLSINDEVASTFGKKGYEYQSLRGFRMRGSMAISPITFYKIE